MGWSEPFCYHFDRGLYFHEVWPRLLCGTQPRNPQEVEELAARHRVGEHPPPPAAALNCT